MKPNFTLVLQLMNAHIYIDINNVFHINLITISFKNKAIYHTSPQELTLFTINIFIVIVPFFDFIFFLFIKYILLFFQLTDRNCSCSSFLFFSKSKKGHFTSKIKSELG